jgi:hypothetical protein
MPKRQPIPPAIFNRICREVGSGKSLRKVLKGKGMPSMHKLFDELERRPELGQQYARARQKGIEHHIDGIIDLADTANAENAHAVRLKVDTRKWIASKILPRIYGDMRQLDVRVTQADIGERLRRARERIREQAPAKVIDAETVELLPAPAQESEAPLPDGFEVEQE